MKNILEKLYNYASLSQKESYNILEEISQEKYNDALVAAFICSYLMRDITVDELNGFREALIDMCIPFEAAYPSTDLCGTGGDSKDTFNISTLSSFIVAGAGIKVTKHGNYGVSSFCGSSNILEALGYSFTNDQSALNKQLDKANICFLHAPLFHPAMKSVAPIRRALGVKTFFNMLGPLVNPAQPKNQLIGVFSLKVLNIYKLLHQKLEKNVTLVHAIDGYDEISLTGDFKLITNKTEKLYTPGDLNFNLLKEEELSGGKNIADAKKIFLDILQNKGTEAQNNVVLANAGTAISNFTNSSLEEGIMKAKASLKNGLAYRALESLIAEV